MRPVGWRWCWAAATAILLASAVYSSGSVTHGFVAYYAAARLLLTGQLGPQAYDDAWFGAYVKAITQSNVIEIFTPNPPTMAWMAAPVAMLDHQAARTVWLIGSVIVFALAVLALLRARRRGSGTMTIALAAVMMLNPSVFANIRLGQGYLIVFALMAAGSVLAIRNRDGWAGAYLGAAFGLKLSGLPLLGLLVFQQRWRVVLTAIGVAAALALAITPLIDPSMWAAFPSQVRAFVDRPSGSVTAYQTTLGLFRHLCVADPVWNPHPAANCERLAFMAPSILIAIAGALTAGVAIVNRSAIAGVIAAGVCLSELSQPSAPEPHFALLAIPLALIDVPMPMFAIVAVLMIVPLEWTAETFTAGWWSLLAYPRLYAAWLLWALSLRAMRLTLQRDGDGH